MNNDAIDGGQSFGATAFKSPLQEINRSFIDENRKEKSFYNTDSKSDYTGKRLNS